MEKGVTVISFGKFVLVDAALVCGCGASLPPKATASGKKVTKTATDADVEVIRDLLNRLTSAINTNNSQHSAAVFTEQGTLLPHGEHTVVGAANIRAESHSRIPPIGIPPWRLTRWKREATGPLPAVRITNS